LKVSVSSMEGLEMRIERLPLGDYLVNDVLLFERKRVTDLVASIKDARFFKQVCRLAGSRYRTGLVLDSTSRKLAVSGMRREAIQGALVTVTVMFGLPILRAMHGVETARLIVYAARQPGRPPHCRGEPGGHAADGTPRSTCYRGCRKSVRSAPGTCSTPSAAWKRSLRRAMKNYGRSTVSDRRRRD